MTVELYLSPPLTLLVKLASIVVHFQEFHSPEGIGLDIFELRRLLADPEVTAWLAEMRLKGLAPVMRPSPEDVAYLIAERVSARSVKRSGTRSRKTRKK
jgi:hypothetical protein